MSPDTSCLRFRDNHGAMGFTTRRPAPPRPSWWNLWSGSETSQQFQTEADIHGLRGVSEGSDRDEIRAGLSVRADTIEIDAAR